MQLIRILPMHKRLQGRATCPAERLCASEINLTPKCRCGRVRAFLRLLHSVHHCQNFLFPSRLHSDKQNAARQLAQIVAYSEDIPNVSRREMFIVIQPTPNDLCDKFSEGLIVRCGKPRDTRAYPVVKIMRAGHGKETAHCCLHKFHRSIELENARYQSEWHATYEEKFHFRAPGNNTGNITFEVVLKQGETNKGAFFYPGSDFNGTGYGKPWATVRVRVASGSLVLCLYMVSGLTVPTLAPPTCPLA